MPCQLLVWPGAPDFTSRNTTYTTHCPQIFLLTTRWSTRRKNKWTRDIYSDNHIDDKVEAIENQFFIQRRTPSSSSRRCWRRRRKGWLRGLWSRLNNQHILFSTKPILFNFHYLILQAYLPHEYNRPLPGKNQVIFIDLLQVERLWSTTSAKRENVETADGWRMGRRSTSPRTVGSAEWTRGRSWRSSSKPANSTTQVLSLHFLCLSFSHECLFLILILMLPGTWSCEIMEFVKNGEQDQTNCWLDVEGGDDVNADLLDHPYREAWAWEMASGHFFVMLKVFPFLIWWAWLWILWNFITLLLETSQCLPLDLFINQKYFITLCFEEIKVWKILPLW